MEYDAEKRFIKNWSGCAHGCKTAEACLERRNRHNALVRQIVKEQAVVKKKYPSLNEACEVFSVPEGERQPRAYNYTKV